MRSVGLFRVIFWIFVMILIASIVTNFYRGQALLGVGEFVVMGLLVFLVIGDEWINLKVTRAGIELTQSEHDPSSSPDTEKPQQGRST